MLLAPKSPHHWVLSALLPLRAQFAEVAVDFRRDRQRTQCLGHASSSGCSLPSPQETPRHCEHTFWTSDEGQLPAWRRSARPCLSTPEASCNPHALAPTALHTAPLTTLHTRR